ncbi:hypothetical protein PF003_g10745 [Phytophthora fragariae]|nr:hypothetical protein PF003_g10745 [Phytophthora fragariae]
MPAVCYRCGLAQQSPSQRASRTMTSLRQQRGCRRIAGAFCRAPSSSENALPFASDNLRPPRVVERSH